MNYKKHYNILISRARKHRNLPTVERHHIIPKCKGGSNNEYNIAFLTPREHFIAHLLLVKIYPDEPKLVYAAMMMTVFDRKQKRSQNRRYEWMRKKHSQTVSKRQSGIGNSQYGKKWISNVTTFESKRINKTDEIPEGWVKGRNTWNKQKEKLTSNKPNKRKIKKEINDERKYLQSLEYRLTKQVDTVLKKCKARWHFVGFMNSDCKSLGEYSKQVNINKMTLSNWFRKYCPDYQQKSLPRTKYKSLIN